ncbi:MAG TPA: ABC transporter substrate-binding protein [Hyphomicrobiales bacterium]|nr:ABC transporter substrate-binding protein [Hyphomicrobiales bacterium]
MTTRRDVLKAAGALAGGAALAMPLVRRAAAADEPLSFMTPFGYIPDFLEMMNMVSGGYLAKQGFAPKLIGGHGTATALQQLVAGSVSFVRMTGIDEFNAVAKQKAPLVSVSTLYQGSNFYFISAKDKPVKTAAEMKGKTIGVVSVGGSTEALLDLALRSAGLTKKDVKIEVVGNSPGAFQYIRQGRVDCFINSLAVVVALQRANAAMEAWPTDRAAPMPAQIYVTSQALIDKKPDVVVRFLKALKGSTDDMLHGDLAAIFQRASKDFEIPGIKKLDELIDLTKFTMANPWMAAGKENFLRNVPKLWNDADKEIRSAGIAAVPNVDALYTNKYIDEALKA